MPRARPAGKTDGHLVVRDTREVLCVLQEGARNRWASAGASRVIVGVVSGGWDRATAPAPGSRGSVHHESRQSWRSGLPPGKVGTRCSATGEPRASRCSCDPPEPVQHPREISATPQSRGLLQRRTSEHGRIHTQVVEIVPKRFQ